MDPMDYYKRIESWSVKKVEEFLKDHHPDDYNLLDVRQPIEYEQGHLPGAIMIPVGELQAGVSQLDPQRPTVVYCASGIRSRAAAATLLPAGFKEVFNLEGGMNAWEGAMAEGLPGEAKVFFSSAKSPEDYIALAWQLEEGARKFYQGLVTLSKEPETIRLFNKLVAAEEHHISTLSALYGKAFGAAAQTDIREAAAARKEPEGIMEGGMRVEEGLRWAEGKDTRTILELSIFLEATSYDRYLFMKNELEDNQTKEIFTVLSNEEKHHLEALTELFEKISTE
jgi:rhodanese-related sulfurtransferase/rubrerythrin